MSRKRWTPQTEITDALLRLREKRKWQLAYRRYVVEQKPSETYAIYFGADIQTLREWFALQFTEGINWDNYGKAWQFEHIIPATYFNFSDEQELKTCWCLLNLRVQVLEEEGQATPSFNLLSAQSYFMALQEATGHEQCVHLIRKIEEMAAQSPEISAPLIEFLQKKGKDLSQMRLLDAAEMDSLNRGTTLQALLLEREILKKFG
jgi:hypothetical protein